MPSQFKESLNQNRKLLDRKLKIHGYSVCREALLLLDDHFRSNLASNKYESVEDFISRLHRTITFETRDGTSVIGPDLAFTVVQKLCNQNQKKQGIKQVSRKEIEEGETTNDSQEQAATSSEHAETIELDDRPPTSSSLTVRVKNVECATEQDQQQVGNRPSTNIIGHIESGAGSKCKSDVDFKIHYTFLYKRLISLPIFQEHFQITTLGTLTASTQPSIRCICFGLLVKNLAKIDGYTLIDNTGRVPVRITPDTTFRNRLAYLNCFVLVEGVYANPDDILYAANIGLPPVLLDPIENKQLACQDEKMIIILKEIYMDDEDVCKAVDLLFTGYDSMSEPPILFILIGDFTRHPCRPSELKLYTKKLIRSIKACDNLKQSHFVFIPGSRDTCLQLPDGELQENRSMPKAPFTREQMFVNFMEISGFPNVHLATNPAHIYVGDRLITAVSHSFIKELKKNLLHDLSDKNEELFETVERIILSNGHLSAGISKTYPNSMNLWHKPDLLILADTEAFGNKYDYSLGKQTDTSFITLPSFSRQSNQFKVYYLKSGDIDDSEVTLDAMKEIEELTIESDGEEEDVVEVN